MSEIQIRTFENPQSHIHVPTTVVEVEGVLWLNWGCDNILKDNIRTLNKEDISFLFDKDLFVLCIYLMQYLHGAYYIPSYYED